MSSFVWIYPGSVDSWIDGDTAVCHVRLAPRIEIHDEHVRIEGINAPELTASDPATRSKAQASRAFALTVAPPGTPVTLRVSGVEKYGRMLAKMVFVDGRSFGDLALAGGYAVVM